MAFSRTRRRLTDFAEKVSKQYTVTRRAERRACSEGMARGEHAPNKLLTIAVGASVRQRPETGRGDLNPVLRLTNADPRT